MSCDIPLHVCLHVGFIKIVNVYNKI